MSIESWKAEFYPVEADKCPKENVVAHSIRKWEGLYADNLKKHGLEVDSDYIEDCLYDRFYIDSSSCALCQTHFTCGDCPLYKVRGDVSCDNRSKREVRSPFKTWTELNRADHMLRWLKKIK